MEYERCDQCCARAFVFFDLGRGQELRYCVHHADLNLDALAPGAVTIVDLRHLVGAHA